MFRVSFGRERLRPHNSAEPDPREYIRNPPFTARIEFATRGTCGLDQLLGINSRCVVGLMCTPSEIAAKLERLWFKSTVTPGNLTK